ncbi:MAG: DegV family protein [Oscillospiraceae bacterium]|nr:DegV family protein [Oscillospiraceae bacterium]
MFQVISDSGCDFTKEEAGEHNVHVVPFYVSFDHENYLKEGVDITRDDYFDRLTNEKGLFPKTSQPSPQDYIDAYTPYLKDGKDIISVTISSELSGSHASAVIAVDTLKEEYPDRTIVLIDSRNASVGQYLTLKEITKMRDAGLSLSETERIAREILKAIRVYFTVENLEYLKRGGRIGPTTALIGGILGLCPILQLSDGTLSQLDNVRGKKNALKLIEEAMVYALKDEVENINFVISHIRSEKDAANFFDNVEKALNMKIANPISGIGLTIGAHTGPGALAFAYCKKYDTFLS